MLALAVASLGLQLLGALAYLIVLPEELDASFNKALPILTEGDYIGAHQIAPVRQVLRAAAWTYFAAALAEVVNIGRWLVLLRRGGITDVMLSCRASSAGPDRSGASSS
jgi:Zn-dependent membrane protease YugP